MKRITYIDGLKGWCAISVCLLHFLLIFVLYGYVGWKCVPEASLNPKEYYFNHFPFSILSNNSFPLYIFFGLISFLICYFFFKKNDIEKIKKQAILRYFRFLPIVVISCFITYLLLVTSLCPYEEYFKLSGNTWAYGLFEEKYTFFDVIKGSFFVGFFEGFQIINPLWCLDYLFLGSMLTYFVMLIYNKIKVKWILYTFLFVVFFFVDQNYLAFIAGMVAAEIANKEYSLKKRYGALIVILGCIIGLFPLVLLPEIITINTLYSIGAGLVIIGTHLSFQNQYLLNNKFIEFVGKESLSLILFNAIILQSVNLHLYIWFDSLGFELYLNLIINLFVNGILSLLAALAASKTITPLTNYLCNQIDRRLLSK